MTSTRDEMLLLNPGVTSKTAFCAWPNGVSLRLRWLCGLPVTALASACLKMQWSLTQRERHSCCLSGGLGRPSELPNL